MTEGITGYRILTDEEKDLINEIKAQEINLKQAIDDAIDRIAPDRHSARWVALARTHLEIGLMFLVKAVGRPTEGLGS